jgi:ribonuclease HI
MNCITYTDGGARGNPGPAGIGGVVLDTEGIVIGEVSEYIGETTNNQAEYRALLATLQKAKSLGATHVDCYLDSQLVVRQMNREYKIKDPGLAQLFMQIYNLSMTIGTVTYTHVPRAQNAAADRLVNKAIDRQLASRRA